MCDFNSLPPEMILAIFSFLDTHSLCQASQTCKDWYDFIYNSDLLWKGKCYSLNQEDIKQDIESGLWWRSIFIRNYGTNLIKKRWLEGRYSQTKALDELPSDINHLGPLSADTWGYILDMEVSRNRESIPRELPKWGSRSSSNSNNIMRASFTAISKQQHLGTIPCQVSVVPSDRSEFTFKVIL
ncbi:hypothetical protein pdam_00000615 [Pocillopora damicornis]|uniref:F-box domain-containing protein n=1 Tax=Pocillopora damicornis TaxID=46731 RepID=A0A3M6TYI8_POCDA|nr:hypothetical protein pdam_00000615 [Pocillopora damicornis]